LQAITLDVGAGASGAAASTQSQYDYAVVIAEGNSTTLLFNSFCLQDYIKCYFHSYIM